MSDHRFGYRIHYNGDHQTFSVFDSEGEYNTNLYVSETEDFSIVKQLIVANDVEGVIEAITSSKNYFQEQRELFRKHLDGPFSLSGEIAEKFSVYLAEERPEDEKAALSAFFTRLSRNPNIHSQDNLFSWLNSSENSLRVTQDGFIVGYRGLTNNFLSRHHGYAIVNGVVSESGAVDNSIGNVISMPRHMVNHDPSTGCSFGLHVGTVSYAKNWGRGGKVVVVTVDPEHVVSVPSDCGAAKMRVCQYSVVAEIGNYDDKEFVIEGKEDSNV